MACICTTYTSGRGRTGIAFSGRVDESASKRVCGLLGSRGGRAFKVAAVGEAEGCAHLGGCMCVAVLARAHASRMAQQNVIMCYPGHMHTHIRVTQAREFDAVAGT